MKTLFVMMFLLFLPNAPAIAFDRLAEEERATIWADEFQRRQPPPSIDRFRRGDDLLQRMQEDGRRQEASRQRARDTYARRSKAKPGLTPFAQIVTTVLSVGGVALLVSVVYTAGKINGQNKVK